MASVERPIGYWLKRLDQLIEARLDSALAADGLSRRAWQVLNVLHDGRVREDAIAEALHPFQLDDIVGELERRGWVERDGDGRHRLTDEGAAVQVAVSGRVQAFRTAMTAGLTAPEYAATVRTLRVMAENLEREPA
jgi:DNA-binding MarR family transcriptional regulator